MNERPRVFKAAQPTERPLAWGDGVVLLGLAIFLYVGIRLALHAPIAVHGPTITLAPAALPWYTIFSLGRMAAAYALSLLFTLASGYLAAHNRRAERVVMPVMDVLQSVPILSFLPVVLLSLSAVLPQTLAAELASIVLIFTSQVWNMAFAWFQSLITIPGELREASTIFRFPAWLRLRTLELPFAAIGLIWNSMMSWAGGWFFLMAAEMFTVGARDFRLPGLGSYLQEAANRGDHTALALGLGTLILVIVGLDQLAWRPLLAWSDRFKLEMVEGEAPARSWFYEALRSSRLVGWLGSRMVRPWAERLDAAFLRRGARDSPVVGAGRWTAALWYGLAVVGGLGLLYGGLRAGRMLLTVPPTQWGAIASGLAATLVRVAASLLLASAWTIPVGFAIGTSPRLAAWLQPVVQVAASVPATALFPIFLLLLLGLPGGLNVAAVFLMLMGTQWYLLFNVIAGAAAIPQDLKYTAALMRPGRVDRWRILILPSLFPYVVTGALTASGGAWNASIVAEHVGFAGQTMETVGIGSLIARATAQGDYAVLLAGTLAMILSVTLINRLLWRRLYRLAHDRYRME